jgi:hypothetical protein
MAVFFDVLLVDERILLHQSYTERADILAKLIATEPGKVQISPTQNLTRDNSPEKILSPSPASRARCERPPIRICRCNQPSRRRVCAQTFRLTILERSQLD